MITLYLNCKLAQKNLSAANFKILHIHSFSLRDCPLAPPLPHCYWSRICTFSTTLFHVTKRFSYKKNSDAFFFILESELEYEGKICYHFSIKPAVFWPKSVENLRFSTKICGKTCGFGPRKIFDLLQNLRFFAKILRILKILTWSPWLNG